MPSSEITSTTDPTHHLSILISRCFRTKHLNIAKLIHSHLIKTGLLTLNIFLTNRLIDMYSKCNSIQSAQRVFDDLPIKNTHSWNTIIAGYSRIGCFDKARLLFDEMPEPNLVSYNSLISSLTHHGFYTESMNVFKRLLKMYSNVFVDEVTVVSVVGTCACLGALQLLRQVHGFVVMIGLELSVVFHNSLIDAYGKCGDLSTSNLVFNRMLEKDVVSWTSMVVAYARASRLVDAKWVFLQMPTKNTVSWTSLISGFAQNGEGGEALDLFKQMQEDNSLINTFTYVSVLSACADLALVESGKQIHARVIRTITDALNLFLGNALIDFYCKCGDMKSARTLFEIMPVKDIVSWNSIITGFAHNGHGEESIVIFKRMIDTSTKPNHVTLLGVLSACSHKGLVYEGLIFLDSMDKVYNLKPRSEHYGILVDLLGRKNKLEEAMDLISKAPHGSERVGMWGAILGSCRVHGNVELARTAAEALFELEPENTGRFVMLSNIYAAAGKWDDAQRVRRLVDELGLRKEAGFSWIEIRNRRYKFVAKGKFHCEIDGIYELLHKLVVHMKDVGYLPHGDDPYFPEFD